MKSSSLVNFGDIPKVGDDFIELTEKAWQCLEPPLPELPLTEVEHT